MFGIDAEPEGLNPVRYAFSQAGHSVAAEITAQDRGKKIIVFKKRRRKGYRRKQGHRQDFTEVRVDSIGGA